MNLGGAIHFNKKFCFVIFTFVVLCYYFAFSKSSTKEKTVARMVNLKDLLHLAILAAENGGVEVKNYKDNHKVESKEKTLEVAEERVTTADYKSHCVMQKTIKDSFPEINLVSEEAKTNCKEFANIEGRFLHLSNKLGTLQESLVLESDVNVWIDPLDATQEYTENLYEYVTTMVCVAVKGTPVIGVIHKPFSKETFWAWVGTSQSSNLKVTPSNRNTSEIIFIVSRSHKGDVEQISSDKLKHYKMKFVEAGGAGYKVLELIKGNADVYLHTTAIKKWDICAGNAVLLSAGGLMTTLTNGSIDYSNTEDFLNKDGLVSTLRNHSLYINVPVS